MPEFSFNALLRGVAAVPDHPGRTIHAGHAGAQAREASLITFHAAAANITLLGIGGALWWSVIGLVAYVVLNGRLPQRVPNSGMLPTQASREEN